MSKIEKVIELLEKGLTDASEVLMGRRSVILKLAVKDALALLKQPCKGTGIEPDCQQPEKKT